MRSRFQIGCLFACLIGIALSANAAEGDARLAPQRADNGMGQWLKRIGKVRLPGENERSHSTVTNAFRDVAAVSTRSTVRVLSDGSQVALGVVVRADGLILTKASELSGRLECLFADASRAAATKVAQTDQLDLALLKVQRTNLPVIPWSPSSVLPVGSWIVTPNLDPLPIAIGVVSAPLHESPAPIAVLGVRMNVADRGVRVNVVMPGTGAARAGVREGDVIATINGRAADSPQAITDIIRGLQPGDRVTLSVLREQEPLSLVATLGDMNRLGGLEQAELMDSLGGPLSRRRAGFSSVIQHDSVIRPRECGGPLVDLDGKAVGVNIARASRVATLALPADLAQRAVQDMLRSVHGSQPTHQTATIQAGATTAAKIPAPNSQPTGQAATIATAK
jgi:serine protease Do